MKNFVAYLIASIAFLATGTAYGQSSGSSDTICISRTDAVKVLKKGLEAKALQEQRDLLLTQVDTLKARISIKDNIISNKDGKILDLTAIINSKDNIIQTQLDQRKILEQNTAALNKELKKQKRKTKAAAFLGILTTGIVTYFFITK